MLLVYPLIMFKFKNREMTKIITKPPTKKYLCSQCGCEFTIDSSDDIEIGYIGTKPHFLPGLTRQLRGQYISCPVCFHKIILKEY